jgi:hypothetical protein
MLGHEERGAAVLKTAVQEMKTGKMAWEQKSNCEGQNYGSPPGMRHWERERKKTMKTARKMKWGVR